MGKTETIQIKNNVASTLLTGAQELQNIAIAISYQNLLNQLVKIANIALELDNRELIDIMKQLCIIKDLPDFNNGDLNFDIEKIESYTAPIVVSKECDFNLEYPYAIDVEDQGYFYANEKERDSDYELLKERLEDKGFDFID